MKESETKRKTKDPVRETILQTLIHHAPLAVLLVILIAASVLLELLPPLVLGQAVDRLTDGLRITASLAAVYFTVSALGGLVNAFREAAITAVGEKLTHALRSREEQKLARLPASTYIASSSGSLTARFTSDADAFESMFSSGIVSHIADLGTVAGMLAVIFRKSPGLGFLLLAVLPLLFAFTRRVQKRMLSAHRDNRKAVAVVQGYLPETIANIRSLHVYHAENFARKRYDDAIGDSFRATERTNLYDALYSPVILTTSAVVVAVMMSLAGLQGPFLALFGISVGTAVTVIAYVGKIFTPLESIGMEIQTIQGAIAGIGRIREFLNLEEMEEPPADDMAKDADGSAEDLCGADSSRNSGGNTGTAPAETGAIVLKNVTFSYDGEHPVLNHFSLDIRKGEKVTLMGRTGAGKSTIFRLILGLYEPDSGSVLVNGTNPRSLPKTQLRSTLACVEQEFHSVEGTVMDQITLGNPEISGEQCREVLRLVGLDRLSDHLEERYSADLLSHGQNQLLSIARAVVCNPEILLLDEMSAGLDSQTEQLLLAALERASAGRTVLSISHRTSAITGDRIVEIA